MFGSFALGCDVCAVERVVEAKAEGDSGEYVRYKNRRSAYEGLPMTEISYNTGLLILNNGCEEEAMIIFESCGTDGC